MASCMALHNMVSLLFLQPVYMQRRKPYRLNIYTLLLFCSWQKLES